MRHLIPQHRAMCVFNDTKFMLIVKIRREKHFNSGLKVANLNVYHVFHTQPERKVRMYVCTLVYRLKASTVSRESCIRCRESGFVFQLRSCTKESPCTRYKQISYFNSSYDLENYQIYLQ
jgi:hypothetical protein